MANIKDTDAIYDPEFEEILSSMGWNKTKAGYYISRSRPAKFMHRFIWEHVHGELPKELDHINRKRHDNRLCNLRPASRELNTLNNGGVNVHRRVRGNNCWQTNLGRSSSLHQKSYALFCHAFIDVQKVKRRILRERST